MKKIILHVFSCLLLGIALLISAISYGQVNWGTVQGVHWKPNSPACDVPYTSQQTQRFPIHTNLENGQSVMDVSQVSPGLHILRGNLNGKAFQTKVLVQ